MNSWPLNYSETQALTARCLAAENKQRRERIATAVLACMFTRGDKGYGELLVAAKHACKAADALIAELDKELGGE